MNEHPLDLHGMPAAVELASPHLDLHAVVVIPARDEAPRIAACLHALASQHDMPAGSYEVIAILDGCRDNTLRSSSRPPVCTSSSPSTPSPFRIPKASDAPGAWAWTSPADDS